MKFFYKIFLSMLLVLTVSLATIEYLTVSYSLEHALQREENTALSQHQMAKYSIQTVLLGITDEGLDKDEQEKKSGKYIRRERYAGACERSFYVGENVTEADIKGEFKHGILKLLVPKKDKPAVEEKKYIAIEG